MLSVVRSWSWEIVAGGIALLALGASLSMSTNGEVAYAPCLAKVVSALRADPAAVRYAKLAGEPLLNEPDGCAMAEDVARAAHGAISDLLLSDATLYARLPRLLADAGMACRNDERTITCDCRVSGPFAIANPFAGRGALVDLPLPLQRALFVAVDKRPALRKGKMVQPGRYVVEVAYRTALFEPEAPPPPRSAALVSPEIISAVAAW